MTDRRLVPLSRAAGRCWSLALLWLISGAAQLLAADLPAVAPPVAPADPMVKVSSLLRAALSVPHAGPLHHQLAHLTTPASSADRVVLRLDADDGPAALAAIAGTGAVVRSHSTRWHTVVVEATLDQIPALAALPKVDLVQPALRPFRRSSLSPDQADHPIQTDALRTAYGSNASGVAGIMVGVISDSIHDNLHGTLNTSTHLLTGDDAQVHGVNPSPITVYDDDTVGGGSDEGYAMMQEIYSLAPNCSYAFGAANLNDTTMATSIEHLWQLANCKVICDDVGFFDEPVFQDGPIAQAAEAFVQAGGVYASAAGNDANQAIQQVFNPLTLDATHVGHNWGFSNPSFPNQGFLPIDVPSGSEIDFVLQWNQPFQSYGLGAGSQADFDLYICSAPNLNPGSVIASSTDAQGSSGAPSGDPLEFTAYENNGASTQRIYVAIVHAGGISNCLLRCMFLTDGYPITDLTQSMNAATTYGHPCAQDVLGVAAVNQISANSNYPGVPEFFTSYGGYGANGLPIYFDDSGNVIAGGPVLRNKPDVAAPDNIIYSAYDPLGFFYYSSTQGFQGTSSAAPHVAAAAALAFCVRPSLSQYQVINGLRGTAADITASPASAGPDPWTGFGMIDALATAGIPVTSVATTASAGIYAIGSIGLSVTFSSPVTVTGSPRLALNTSPVEYATYTGGSGTSTLTFSYVVQPGDVAANLAPANVAALQLQGGSILDGSSLPVDTALPAATGSPGGTATPFLASGALDIDSVPPTATVTPTPSISNQRNFAFVVLFSQPVSTLAPGSVGVTNGTLNSLNQNNSTSYTALVTATATGSVVLSIPAAAVSNGAFGNLAASGTAIYDTTPPTLSIGLPPSADTNTTVTATFTFSKVVSGFSAADIAVVDGSVGTVSGSGTTYSAPILAGSLGTMTVTVAPTASILDLAGNSLAVGATASMSVVNPPPASHHCGLGGIGLVFGSLMLWRWRRRQPLALE